MEPLSLKPVKDKKNGCIDFDGVINMYDGWHGDSHFPPLRPGVQWFLRELSKQYNLFILTARTNIEEIQAWLEENNIAEFIAGVTHEKIGAHFYLDDRAIQFRGDFYESLTQIVEFKPHWK